MGLEFVDLFESWADAYDQTVHGDNEEYREAFDRYDEILNSVATRATGTVLEFGLGTGNLTERLLHFGLRVYGVEPAAAMRKILQKRFPEVEVFNGGFLKFPEIEEPIHTIVSTYAFHHLTDTEKGIALQRYAKLLPKNGKVVFADTVFESEQARLQLEEEAQQRYYMNLYHDLKTEYYTTTDVMIRLFNRNGFDVTFTRLNKFVWLMDATLVGELNQNQTV